MMKIFLTALFACLASASAEMVFETKLVKIHAAPDADVVTAEFPFKIEGDPVEIVEYDAPCSCLTARVEPLLPDRSPKLKWTPGETGKIISKFKMGNFKGTIDKAILLTLRGHAEPVQLVVRVHIPVLFGIEPPTHQWKVDEEPAPKVFKVRVNGKDPIRLMKHTGQNENFPYEVKTIKEGWEYEITVTPKSTKSPGMGRIALFTDSSIKRHRRHQVFMVIKRERK